MSLAAVFRRKRDRDSGRADIPPADQGDIIWAWDPDLAGAAAAKVGPVGTPVTPVRTAGPPGFYTFGATDNIQFGDSLDAFWTGGLPWTIHIAINPSAGDIAAPTLFILYKDSASTNREWNVVMVSGVPQINVFYGGLSANQESASSNGGAMTAAKHVLSVTFDPTQVFGSRCTIYVDGVNPGQTRGTLGSDGTILDTTGVLQQGYFPFGAPTAGPTVQSYIYGYKRVQTPSEILANYNWIHLTKGW